MATGVAGRYFLDANVDGQPLPLSTSNVNKLAIINNIHQFLPSIQLDFKDGKGVIDGDLSRVSDGRKLNLSIGNPAHHIYENMNFRITGTPSASPAPSWQNIGVRAFLDAMKYQRKIVDTFYEGNTSDVISQLAGEVGLNPVVDSTQDTMTWLPNSKNIAQFANHLADRGWASDKSLMMLATQDNGDLIYKDIDKAIANGGRKVLASDPAPGETGILMWAAKPKSHVSNSANAYGSTSMGMGLDGKVQELNRTAAQVLGGLSVSSFFQDVVGDLGTRVENIAQIAGNTHENWYNAQHQNRRLRSQYAYDVKVMSDIPLQVSLLDVVTLRPVDPKTGEVVQNLVGDYVVTTNTKFLNGNGFVEKATLTNQGASSNGNV